ncbi:helix-turn-helix domain-containing protein [Corynebacterium sphenisci]|uniref:helix-turn-helix domain-containing protein n=1 Tax=Corynebacterium sphenisci TaxID=191493 RepID=UPI0012F4E685|nr:helix-turn-helix domain-containing protein [Corynebacterium sphenisci]
MAAATFQRPVGLRATHDTTTRSEDIMTAAVQSPGMPVRDAAAYLGVSTGMVYKLARRAHDPIPHYRVAGRILIRRSDLDSWRDRQ